MEKELKEQLEALKENVKGLSKEEAQNEIKAFKAEMEKEFDAKVESKAKELIDAEVEKLNKSIEAVQEHADKLDIKLGKKGSQMESKSLEAQIKERKEEVKSIVFGDKRGDLEFKDLTQRSSVSDNAQGFFIPEITQLGHKNRSLYNVLPKVFVGDNNTGGVVRYRDWDEATTVRAAAMVAEGAAFPESTAKFKWYNIDLKKVGDTLPVTEEFFEDEAQAAAELSMFLNVNVELKIDDQIVNGDNTGQNLEGLMTSAPEFTPVAAGIPAPNLKDLAIKTKNDITRTRGSKYSPDFMALNSSSMESLVLAKDNNNNYLFDENTGTIGGLFVVIDENIADNECIIGDRRYARIYEKTGVIISKGQPNSQFLEDEETIKVRKRMLLLVKNGDKTGFRKISDIPAALTILGTAV